MLSNKYTVKKTCSSSSLGRFFSYLVDNNRLYSFTGKMDAKCVLSLLFLMLNGMID